MSKGLGAGERAIDFGTPGATRAGSSPAAARREPAWDRATGAGPAAPLAAPAWAQPARSTRPDERHAVVFTGSGSEYFRIWIVNLLLTLATLGLYYPWAKARRLKYFHTSTRVAGHALDFHGDPRRMLRGFLLTVLLFGAYGLAGQVSPVAGGIALLILAAVWPALFCASMRFRLANTSWRGLRLRFTGSVADAYRAFAPVVAGMAAFGALAALGQAMEEAWGKAAAGVPMMLAVLAFYACLPYTFYRVKKYQHEHYACGQLQAQLRVEPGDFYRLFFKTGGVTLLASIAAGVAFALVAGGAIAGARGRGSAALIWAILPGLVLMFVLFQAIVQPYFVSRLQNLLWTQTGNSRVRFKSQLTFMALFLVTFRNWLLVMLTLGLYWPFAAVATARLKLQAVSLHTRFDLEQLTAAAGRGSDDASGDVAAEVFGLDIGL
ncbi:MAG: DUF898 domain-containing protein [Burkholderiales bacterium]|nr:DUF898 domain-containing protein [Burkholderiales bacterium]